MSNGMGLLLFGSAAAAVCLCVCECVCTRVWACQKAVGGLAGGCYKRV